MLTPIPTINEFNPPQTEIPIVQYLLLVFHLPHECLKPPLKKKKKKSGTHLHGTISCSKQVPTITRLKHCCAGAKSHVPMLLLLVINFLSIKTLQCR